ncbi:isopropylmalate isomerase [Erythrobacter sp. CCH5-A1]|jgi:LPXTG-motif cell wall-anchored protein|uniref:isopropylmalate isomerase n=1 Tax=Erythrobacter sp. CCH5-A1 TaxID=1768792 RepID=UPI000829538B|nr:isopropylmalate isomerase [Erythrobacter sp. CCH5-A1]
MTDKPKNNTARNAAIAAAGAIGSAAVAAALLYAGKRKKKPANEPTQPGPIPSGEPPQTD